MRFDTHIHLDALPDETLASALFAAPDYRAFVPGIEPAGVAAALLRFLRTWASRTSPSLDSTLGLSWNRPICGSVRRTSS